MSGHIFQINVSEGGVPKVAIAAGDVSAAGLSGDRQRDRRHHGGSERALCLYSLEHILALQREGHPIYPGAIGENVTIAGLDWERLTPGVSLRLGAAVEIAITSYTAPCNNVAFAFADGNMNRVSQKKHPGWSRLYARVLQPGRLAPGDPVTLFSP